MKKIQILSFALATSLVLAGCSKTNQTTTTDIETPAEVEPTSSPESMMIAPMATPVPQETPIDISTDTQLKSTKPLGSTDDSKTLKSDLNSTTIVNESFN